MSFVMFAGCEYFGIMIGDRRCVDDNFKVLSNNAEKVRQINENVAICGAGSESIIYTLWDLLTKYNPADITYKFCVELFTAKCQAIEQNYLENYSQTLTGYVGVMGNNNGVLFFTLFAFLSGEIHIEEVCFSDDSDPSFCFLATGQSGKLGKMFEQEFNRFKRFDLGNLTDIFQKILRKEYKNDPTINKKYIAKQVYIKSPDD